ncbi:MAG: hypothetical protein QM831_44010 [Kofleriaceae bacterium]
MKTRQKTQKDSQLRGVVRDWQPLFKQLESTIDWALDLAVRLARDYEEEIEAIERVRSYVRGWLAGRRIDLDLNDLLTTLGILFAAIELDEGIESVSWIEPLRAFEHTRLHFPGAAEIERDTVTIRPPRRYRNRAASTHLAA